MKYRPARWTFLLAILLWPFASTTARGEAQFETIRLNDLATSLTVRLHAKLPQGPMARCTTCTGPTTGINSLGICIPTTWQLASRRVQSTSNRICGQPGQLLFRASRQLHGAGQSPSVKKWMTQHGQLNGVDFVDEVDVSTKSTESAPSFYQSSASPDIGPHGASAHVQYAIAVVSLTLRAKRHILLTRSNFTS